MGNKSMGWEIHLIKKSVQNTWWIVVGRDADSQFAQTPVQSPEDGLQMVKFLDRLLPQLEFYERFESEYNDRCKLEEELGGMNAKSARLMERLDEAERRLRDARHAFRMLAKERSKKRVAELMAFIKKSVDLEPEKEVAKVAST